MKQQKKVIAVTPEEVDEYIRQCDNAIVGHGKALESLRKVALESQRHETIEMVMKISGEIEWFSIQREIWKELKNQIDNMTPPVPPSLNDPILN